MTEDGGVVKQQTKPEIPAIMEDVRRRVLADVEAHKDRRAPFRPYGTSDTQASRTAGEMVHSEELRFLNMHHAYPLTSLNLDSVRSHRPGIVGRVLVKVKRKFLSLIWENLLKEYLFAEKEFHSNLVRFLNDFSRYADARDASNFWDLIRKIDYDVTKALERIERIGDEASASMHAMEQRLRTGMDSSATSLNTRTTLLQAQVEAHQAQLDSLGSSVSGLEGILSRISSRVKAACGPADPVQKEEIQVPDCRYLLLENRYRGSEGEIRRRLDIYPPLFNGVQKNVLEIGPGRGELQVLFAENSVPSYGVDLDGGMVEEAQARSLKVTLGDGVVHMRGLEDGFLGGVIAIQVVEHLPLPVLTELLDLCFHKVTPGGRIVFETIDPRSLLALSSNYFRDPTHVFPLHPDTLAFAMTTAGLKVEEVRPLSGVPIEAQLKEIPVEEYMTPRWVMTVERLNRNIRQLNSLLYGNQDYCVIAVRP